MHIVKITDGLGNQMFQYAFAKWLEMETHSRVFLDARFINNEDDRDCAVNCFQKKQNDLREYKLDCYRLSLKTGSSKFLRIARKLFLYKDEEKNGISDLNLFPTYYKGYFFNLEYLEPIRKSLQKEFVLKSKIKLPKEIRTCLKNNETVSIHVRRGDFLRINRDISQKEYYPKAIDYINAKVKNPFFFIFSDDIEWVKRNMSLPENTIFVSDYELEDYEELAVMKHCNHNIIANSTFSYWGAYLNTHPNKIVVCPNHWKSEIIPLGWVKI